MGQKKNKCTKCGSTYTMNPQTLVNPDLCIKCRNVVKNINDLDRVRKRKGLSKRDSWIEESWKRMERMVLN